MSIDYDPLSPKIRDDPYPYYAALRDQAPVYWAESARVIVISRYEDVAFVLKSPDLFSSEAMRTMLVSDGGPDAMQDPATLKRIMDLAAALPFAPHELMASRNLIAEDTPRHGPMRGLVNRGFTTRRIQDWEARARSIVETCMEGLGPGDEFDVIGGLAVPLPVTLIAEILGVEPERMDDFKHWSDVLISGLSGSRWDRDVVESGFADAMGSLQSYILDVVKQREQAPGDDLISVLVEAREGGAALCAVDVVMFVLLLLVAGNETTTHLIGHATAALLAHPEQLARVRADRGRVPALVEEALRYAGPVQLVYRRATRDVEIAGTRIPAGAVVAPLLASANRDERQWGPDAGVFRIDRDPQGHVAFGLGIHYCLGASLARLEARLALDALLDVLPGRSIAPGRTEYVDSFLVRGLSRLVLTPVS